MNWNGKKGWGFLFILLGAVLLLHWFIPVIGYIVKLLMPLFVIGLGFYGIMRGKKWIGIILLFIGAIMFLSKASAYLGLILAGVFIYFGISMLLKQKRS